MKTRTLIKGGVSMKEVKVGIVMGSDSDLPVMKQAVTVLDGGYRL